MRLPDEIRIGRKPDILCHPPLDDGGSVTVRTLMGVVLCDCPDEIPVANAEVSVSWDGGTHARRARTDRHGRFELRDIPSGTYTVYVSGGRSVVYLPRTYEVRLSPQAATEGVTLKLRKDPQPPSPPVAEVIAAPIPVYPTEARAAGVEGKVTLRLTFSGNDLLSVDGEGAPTLVAAATEQVRAWKLRNVRVPFLVVTIQYRLLPGDCAADQRPSIVARFPTDIAITARRLQPCGGKRSPAGS
jgi:hypothetical protein